MSERLGDWMQTFTGRQFWPMDPRTDEVHIADIAHALAHLCRYGGHSQRFYSVAEHSVLMARAVSPKHRLWALLHDASEAYLVDVPRPVKRFLQGYKTAEAAVMMAICARYEMSPDMPAEVHAADEAILHDELAQAMAPPPIPWRLAAPEPLGTTLQFWSPVMAEIQFMTLFDKLTDSRFAATRAFINPGPGLGAAAAKARAEARRNG